MADPLAAPDFVVKILSGRGFVGTGILLTPQLVLTCWHCCYLNSDTGDYLRPELKVQDNSGGIFRSLTPRADLRRLDLALLELDFPLPLSAPPRFLCDFTVEQWEERLKPLPWWALGYVGEDEGRVFRKARLAFASLPASPGGDDTVDDQQILGGLKRGLSGGPVAVRTDASIGGGWIIIGQLRLGRDEAPVSRFRASSALLEFLTRFAPRDVEALRLPLKSATFTQRHRNRKWIGAAALAISILGLGWWGFTNYQAKERERVRQVEAARVQADHAANEEAARNAIARASEEALEALRVFALMENATMPLFGRPDRAPLLELITNNPALIGRMPLYQDLPLLRKVKQEELIQQRVVGRERPGESFEAPVTLPEMTIRAWEEAALLQSVRWGIPATVEELFRNAKSPPRFAVVGPPGSGKSTFLRALAYKLAKGQIRHGSETLTPIQIELREWESWFASHGGNLADYLAASMDDLFKKDPSLNTALRVSPGIVNSLLEQGRVCVLLDGFDEIRGDRKFTELLEGNLKTEAWSKTPLLLACRTVSFEAHQRFCPGFEVYRVSELNREQRDAFVRAYPARYSAGFQAELLLKQLDEQPAMEPLWGNPLLLSLICYAVDGPERMRLPTRRTELYDRVVMQLLDGWKDSRLKELKDVDPDDLLSRRVLERVALDLFASWDRARKLSFGKEEFNAALVRALTAEAVDRSIAGPMLQHLTAKPGLLRRSREGEYAFLHLTLHEYLAGACLARLAGAHGSWDSQLSLGAGSGSLRSLVDAKAWDPAWREVLLFMAGSSADASPLISLLADETADGVGRPRLRLAVWCWAETGAGSQPRLERSFNAHGFGLNALGDTFLRAFLGPRAFLWFDTDAARALRCLTQAGYAEPVVARLVELSRDSDGEVRRRAVDALGKLGEKGATERVLSRLMELSRDPKADVRWNVVYALGQLGEEAVTEPVTEPVLTRLVDLIRDPDENVRRSARAALGRLGEKVTTEPVPTRLVDLSRDPDEDVRRTAVLAIRGLGEKAATELVLTRLVDLIRDPDEDVRSSAVLALRGLGEKAATEPVLTRLVDLIRDPDEDFRSSAVVALVRLGEKAAIEPVLVRLVDLIRDRNADDHAQGSAAHVLGQLGEKGGTEEVLSRLLQLVRDPDAALRRVATLTLGQLGRKAATELVLDQLMERSRDLDASVRCIFAHALVELGEKGATEPVLSRLVELSRDPEADVRRSVVYALGHLGEKAATAPVLARLIELNRDADADVGFRAAYALLRLGKNAMTELVLARLVELSGDPDTEVRISAVFDLGQLGEKAATAPIMARLVDLSRDSDADVRRSATYALVQLSEKAATAPIMAQLVDLIRNPDEDVRSSATYALGQLGEKGATEPVLSRLVDLSRDSDADVRRSATYALGQLSEKGATEPVLSRLVDLSRDPDADVRSSATYALGKLGAKAESEPVLSRLVELIRDPEADVRKCAVNALGDIGAKAATEPMFLRLLQLTGDTNAGIRSSAATALVRLPENGLRWFSVADGHVRLDRVENLAQWPPRGPSR